MMEKRWHCSVGFTLTCKDGNYCGFVGCAIPCFSQEDGWRKGLDWLRKHKTVNTFLLHVFKLEVRYF